MGMTSGNPSVLLVEEVNMNGKGRVILPKVVRKIIGIEDDGKVKLTLYADRTVKLKRA